MTSFSELGRCGGQGHLPLPECLFSGATCLPVGLLLCASHLSLASLPESPVECRDGAVQGGNGTSAGEETGDGGSDNHERGHRSGQEGSREKEEGKREKAKEDEVAGVGELGGGIQSLGLHQLLSGDGAMCTLCFYILSSYSCWDTASTDARISSSSQSFRPMSQSLRQ